MVLGLATAGFFAAFLLSALLGPALSAHTQTHTNILKHSIKSLFSHSIYKFLLHRLFTFVVFKDVIV